MVEDSSRWNLRLLREEEVVEGEVKVMLSASMGFGMWRIEVVGRGLVAVVRCEVAKEVALVKRRILRQWPW